MFVRSAQKGTRPKDRRSGKEQQQEQGKTQREESLCGDTLALCSSTRARPQTFDLSQALKRSKRKKKEEGVRKENRPKNKSNNPFLTKGAKPSEAASLFCFSPPTCAREIYSLVAFFNSLSFSLARSLLRSASKKKQTFKTEKKTSVSHVQSHMCHSDSQLAGWVRVRRT